MTRRKADEPKRAQPLADERVAADSKRSATENERVTAEDARSPERRAVLDRVHKLNR